MAKEVVYVIKVIEPESEYMKYFRNNTLDNCRQKAQEYLWSCPEDTKYIYVATRLQDAL
jgi:hypothetical protein